MASSLPGSFRLTICRVWPGCVPGMAGGWVRLPRLAGICSWDGGWLGAFAAFGRDTSANVGRKRPGRGG